MAMSAWLVLVGVCLLYVALGLWAVSQIFPATDATDHRDRDAPAERHATISTNPSVHSNLHQASDGQ